jgi:hypothetical protein
MKTKTNHFFGRQDHYDLQLVKLELDLESSREHEALDQGWSIYDGKWIQSRLTRLRLDAWVKSPKPLKGHTVQYVHSFVKSDEVEQVYAKFLEYKGFNPHFDLYCDMDRSSVVEVRKDGKLTAFTKFVEYDGGIESQFTVWDYADPKMSLGRKIVDFEIQNAKDLGYDFLYIGPGYDDSSVYKSSFPGFEWWTGSEWSTDKDKYIELCKSDASVQNLDDLNDLFNGFKE